MLSMLNRVGGRVHSAVNFLSATANRFTPDDVPIARRIADHIGGSERSRASRMYVGDDYRAVVITLPPGDAQEVHVHPTTDHAWSIGQSWSS